MKYLITAILLLASVKISFLTIYQQWPLPLEAMSIIYLFALNGLPIIMLWFLLRRFTGNCLGLLVITLLVDTICFTNIAKVYILDDPVRFTDIYELSNMLGVKNSITKGVPSIAYFQWVDSAFIMLLLFKFKYISGKEFSTFDQDIQSTKPKRLTNANLILLSLIVVVIFAGIYYKQLPGSKPPFRKGYEPWISELHKYYRMGAFNYFVTSGIKNVLKYSYRTANSPSRSEVETALITLRKRATSLPVKVEHKTYPNVIIILMESVAKLSLDAPRIKSSGEIIAPFLQSMQNQLLYSTNIFSPMYGGATSECEFIILTSLNSRVDSTGYAYTSLMDREYMSLPKLLKRYGYYNAVFHAYKRDFWHRVNAYKSLGFDRYDSEDHYRPGTVVGMGLSDGDFLSQSADKLRKLPQPFFAFLITLSGHHPFSLPTALTSNITDKTDISAPYVKKYLENLNYVDRSLESFWNNISDLRSNSIVIFIGDHNPPLPDGEDWKSLGYEVTNKKDPSFLPSKQVPLIISAPFLANKVHQVKDVIGDQADIAPSLLYLLGIPSPKFFTGKSLFSPNTSAMQFTDNIYHDKLHKYSANDGLCFDNFKNTNLGLGECAELISQSKAIEIISKDILWGKMHSYSIK